MDAEIRNAFAPFRPRHELVLHHRHRLISAQRRRHSLHARQNDRRRHRFTFAEISDLIHSVDPAYRASNTCGFMFNDVVLNAIKNWPSDRPTPAASGSPWREGEPDRIEGYRYWINQGMDSTIDTASKIMLFGDFQYYVIRLVQELVTLRLNERYADNGPSVTSATCAGTANASTPPPSNTCSPRSRLSVIGYWLPV